VNLRANGVFGLKDYVGVFAEGISSLTFKGLKSIELKANSFSSNKGKEVVKLEGHRYIVKLFMKLPYSL
jgi:hypothetical protein